MLELKDVTLVCVSDVKLDESFFAFDYSKKEINFGNTLFLSSKFKNIDYPIDSKEKYSEFIIKDLAKYIHTSHALIIQWDGFVINPSKWSDDFLQYDYIGAIWAGIYCEFSKNTVGNGGFSLRSKKLLDFCSKKSEDMKPYHPEDAMICRHKRDLFKDFKFAPEKIAANFCGDDFGYIDQFGFHGETHKPL